MKLSLDALNRRARESCLVWMASLLGAWLLLEAGPFFLGAQLFRIPVRQLIGPYIALAVPPAAAGPLIWRVNQRRADPPKRRARDMAITTLLFADLSFAALFYSGVELGLTPASVAIPSLIITWLMSGILVYFVTYRTALAKATLSLKGGDGRDQPV